MATPPTPTFVPIYASATASRVGTYVPAFATSSTYYAHTYTSYGPASSTAGAFRPDPTTPSFVDNLDWVTAYLLIHSLSKQSYVYTYLLWMGLFALFVVFSIMHVSRLRGGTLGALYSKWSLRRRTWRKKHSLRKRPHTQPKSLPSNAQIVSISLLAIAIAVLCFVGPDYLNPDTHLFDFSTNHTNVYVPPYASGYNKRDSTFDPIVVIFFEAHYAIEKALWTSAARVGDMAFALFPLCILFVLKAPPFALFALPFTLQYYFDKLLRLHRWTGRFIWALATAHAVMWSIQFTRDIRAGTTNNAWHYVWVYPKFRYAWAAYGCLTLLVVLSIRPIRKQHYELFYFAHILLVPLTLIFSALHHPPLWWWCWAALALWLCERTWRFIWWVYTNGVIGRNWHSSVHGGRSKASYSEAPLHSPTAYKFNSGSSSNYALEKPYHMRSEKDIESFELSDMQPPMPPFAPAPVPAGIPTVTLVRPRSGAETPDSERGSLFYENFDRDITSTPSTAATKFPLAPSAFSLTRPIRDTTASEPIAAHMHTRYVAPPGFAHAVLLPGRMIRLRLVTPGYFVWAPGQHVLVCLPSLSKFTTHPFTIASVCDEQVEVAPAGKEAGGPLIGPDGRPAAGRGGREIVLLVRAKRGWTLRLWNLIARLQEQGASQPSGEVLPEGSALPPRGAGAGVVFRALIDGPFGSSVRARWNEYSSVLIVTGGSGVSYGLSILEFVCLCLAGRDGRFLGGKRGGWGQNGFRTQRVRFVWLVREYSHVQWCASQIRRCLAILPTDAVEISIFVTNHKPLKELEGLPYGYGQAEDALLPPNPRFAKGSKFPSESESSLASQDSYDSYVEMGYAITDDSHSHETNGIEEEGELGHESHILDYTNFDDDDDTPLPGESRLSRTVRKEGHIRRAKTRKVKKAIEAKYELDERAELGFIPPSASYGYSTGSGKGSFAKRGSAMSSEPLIAPLSPSSPSPEDPYPRNPGVLRNDVQRQSVTALPPFPLTSPASRLSNLNELAPDGSWKGRMIRPTSYASSRSASSFEMVPTTPTGNESSRWLGPEVLVNEGAALSVEPEEMEDLRVVSELTRPGRPRLDRILAEEVERSKGRVAVACCGPTSLNALMRKLIAAQIDPARVFRGDLRGSIDFISEDFEF